MNIGKGYHLTYCTNIHPGETWIAVFESLEKYILPIKANISPGKPFGIGLRLSDVASKEIEEGNNLEQFKQWLTQNGLYVFTMNGFPFGSFHRSVVKADVHTPDWTTPERYEYTKRLARILAHLLPEGMEGGISTSPISYKHWFSKEDQQRVLLKGTGHFAKLTEDLYQLQLETGKTIHIDIEPEPDGLLENSTEFLHYYNHMLLPEAGRFLQEKLGLNAEQAEAAVRSHIQLCYDVCHFALAYEEPEQVFDLMEKENIKIGKIQISAALKVDLPANLEERKAIGEQFQKFTESTYLHQVLVRNRDGSLTQYPDLPPALEQLQDTEATEWRAHFHVPIFLDKYQDLQSTQADIVRVLQLLETRQVTQHLEVETYTWEVLPVEIKQELGASIQRELEWVLQNIQVE